jgi:small conductance mechanosensitive channel
MVLNQFGVQTASLIAVLGAAGLAVGLALQGTLSNVAAGVMMLILRPFNVGDFIEFNGKQGTVKSLNLFGTELATLDNVYLYAPNSTIWTTDIYNYSRNAERRQDLSFSISYSDDINKAFKTIQKVLDKDERVLKTEGKEPYIGVEALGGSSVDIKVRIWTAADHFFVKLDLIKAVKEALDKDGLTIPFPTQTLEIAEVPEALAAKSSKSSSKKKAA